MDIYRLPEYENYEYKNLNSLVDFSLLVNYSTIVKDESSRENQATKEALMGLGLISEENGQNDQNVYRFDFQEFNNTMNTIDYYSVSNRAGIFPEIPPDKYDAYIISLCKGLSNIQVGRVLAFIIYISGIFKAHSMPRKEIDKFVKATSKSISFIFTEKPKDLEILDDNEPESDDRLNFMEGSDSDEEFFDKQPAELSKPVFNEIKFGEILGKLSNIHVAKFKTKTDPLRFIITILTVLKICPANDYGLQNFIQGFRGNLSVNVHPLSIEALVEYLFEPVVIAQNDKKTAKSGDKNASRFKNIPSVFSEVDDHIYSKDDDTNEEYDRR